MEQRLLELGLASQCGLQIIDLNTGQVVHSLMMESIVEELFDVVILPKVSTPTSVGFMEEDIDRLVNFPGSKGLVTTKPTVSRPGATDIQVAGLPRQSQLAQVEPSQVNYQRVYHLTPDNLAPYDALTYPSLQKRWQTQPQQGELHAVSASVDGQMVGFIVAEQQPDTDGQAPRFAVLSLFVLPAYRHQGIATVLKQRLQQALRDVE
ncbi:MAG: GNAT family N-acetyltransferase [Methylococcales bacterium]|nr:GNAT family N-acetyltransferase [Methylococcales bacterium]